MAERWQYVTVFVVVLWFFPPGEKPTQVLGTYNFGVRTPSTGIWVSVLRYSLLDCRTSTPLSFRLPYFVMEYSVQSHLTEHGYGHSPGYGICG